MMLRTFATIATFRGSQKSVRDGVSRVFMNSIRSRAAGQVHAGIPGRPRYAVAHHAGRFCAMYPARLAAMGEPRTWWRRMADDREFVGAKLLVLAVLIALTAMLEGAV